MRSVDDLPLMAVSDVLLTLDPDGSRWAAVVRKTYDMIYNGQETGRYRWDQLMKTEKTHFGTLLEINAQREFGFADGDTTDYRIAGHQVDAKWSQKDGGWMLPPEVFGELALVATGSDADSKWSVGLIRVTEEVRREGSNRDKKSSLNATGRQAVHWVWKDAPLRPNVLLQLPQATLDRILSPKSGTQRLARLFREAEGMIVHRNAVGTVARQLDAQKRVRGNGGARSVLQPDGFLILSGVYHRDVAAQLGAPIPLRDEYISLRVAPTNEPSGVMIANQRWRLARADEVVTRPAPAL